MNDHFIPVGKPARVGVAEVLGEHRRLAGV